MTSEIPPDNPSESGGPWYAGVTRYQWIVLAIASAGWLFDVFEGQLFGACMYHALADLLPAETFATSKEYYINLGLSAFMVGAAIGGVLFGAIADVWSRKWTMAITILWYSLFTGVTVFVDRWEYLVILRLLVGMGVGGEWAVAAALVAEVFPQRARPIASGIFHASSVLGTYMAVGAALLVPIISWRYGFALGVIPAILVLFVRIGMKEPGKAKGDSSNATTGEPSTAVTATTEVRPGSQAITDPETQTRISQETENVAPGSQSLERSERPARPIQRRGVGAIAVLFTEPKLLAHTLLATILATIGLVTFWGVHFRGRDLVRNASRVEQQRITDASESNEELEVSDRTINWHGSLGWFLLTTGGGVGLLTFAPVSQKIGRRVAFIVFHVGAFLVTFVAYFLSSSLMGLLVFMPLFGFFTLAMHAGYAVYFPELFPTRVRGTGVGFSFNVSKLATAPALLFFAWLQTGPFALTFAQAVLALGCLFLLGVVVALVSPETRGQPLPE
ncbi:MAG: MFS transporter [Gemmataceae bacterium]